MSETRPTFVRDIEDLVYEHLISTTRFDRFTARRAAIDAGRAVAHSLQLDLRKCTHCGRMLTVTAGQAAAIESVGFTGSSVVPAALRSHKCQHGNWCDECRDEVPA